MPPGVYLSASSICLWTLSIVLFLLSALENTSVHSNLQYFSQYRVFTLPWDPPALTAALGRGHRSWDVCSLFLPSVFIPASPLVCSFHSVVFSFLFFSSSVLSGVTLFCSLITADTSGMVTHDFSSTAPVHQEWTELCLFFSSMLGCLFHWMFPHSLFFCQNLCPSLILNLSIFFLLSLLALDAPFLAHRELFHEQFVFIRIWKTLRFSSFQMKASIPSCLYFWVFSSCLLSLFNILSSCAVENLTVLIYLAYR